MKHNRVLIIAGSDSGGGAGIQGDIKTVSACGCFATTAVTAITVQNTTGVKSVFPIPDQIVGDQIDAVLTDIGADSIKIGMLHSEMVIKEVSKRLNGYSIKSIVLDPVMVATSGDPLLEESAIAALKEYMLPIAKIITPNIPEAERLLGVKISSLDEMKEAAKSIGMQYKTSVLVKGGHLIRGEQMSDVLFDAERGEISIFHSSWVDTKNTHGTGCTLSSAIASFLAKGESLYDSVREGVEYINSALVSGAKYEIGEGHGPVHHFNKFWK